MKLPAKSGLKKVVLLIIILFILLQLFPGSERNRSDAIQPFSIGKLSQIPDTVNKILEIACYDCHSNNTKYPWYTNIQPVDWYLNHHIMEGKRELNFDEFLKYSTKRQYNKLESIVSQVEEGEMPLFSYTLLHTKAKLSGREKQLIMEWARNMKGIIH